jgi:hypothetical protein
VVIPIKKEDEEQKTTLDSDKYYYGTRWNEIE